MDFIINNLVTIIDLSLFTLFSIYMLFQKNKNDFV